MDVPDFRLAFRALEEEEIDRADLVRLLTVLESYKRGDLTVSCAELLSREFRVDPAKIRRWEGELAGQPSNRIGKYRLKRRIGQGGMGVVYEADHPNLDRSVALKILTPGQRDPAAMQRFLREVKSAGRFNHPSIVHAYDAGIDGDVPFLAMEFVQGENLYQILLRRGPMEPDLVIDCLAQATSALWFLEAIGWTHGDGKPSNWVLTESGTLKLIDLGLCRPPGKPRRPELIHGSPPYIAPEALGTGRRIDIRSDLFALGATFFHLLAGRPHYQCRSVVELVKLMRKERPARLQDLRPEISDELAGIIERLMDPEPERRFQSCSELAPALEALGAPRVVPPPGWEARDPSSDDEPERSSTLTRTAILVAGLLSAAVGVWLGVVLLAEEMSPAKPEPAQVGSAEPEPPVVTEPPLVAAPGSDPEAEFLALFGEEPRPYRRILSFVEDHVDEPRANEWQRRTMDALQAEAQREWAVHATRVEELLVGRSYARAEDEVDRFPDRLRIGPYQVAVERARVDIAAGRAEFLEALLARLARAVENGDVLGAQYVFRSVFREPTADRDRYLSEIDQRYPDYPWLTQVLEDVARTTLERQAREAEIRATLVAGRLPAPDWSMPGGPELEWLLEVLKSHPELVGPDPRPLVDRLFETGLLAELDLASAILICDLLGSDSMADAPALSEEHEAARLLAQAERACRSWGLETATQCWQALLAPALASTAASRSFAPRADVARERLEIGVAIRSGIVGAEVSGQWGESPTFAYVFEAPRAFLDWRREDDRWGRDGDGYRPRAGDAETTLLENFIPFEGPQRVEVEFTPTRTSWLWHMRYGQAALGLRYDYIGELFLAVGDISDVEHDLDHGLAPRWLEGRLGNERLTLILEFGSESMTLELAGRRHTVEFDRTMELRDWFGMMVPVGMVIHRIAITGDPNPIWVRSRPR